LESAVLEAKAGAGDQVLDGAGHQDLTRPGGGRDAGADVDGEPGDLVVPELDLPGVQAGPDREPERGHAAGDRARAPDRPGRAVEGGEEAIARGVDLAPPEAPELAADEVVVSVEEVSPAAIPEGGGLLRGADDVGEEDGRQYPVGLGTVTNARQEFLDLVDNRVRVVPPGDVIDPGELHELGSGDSLGHEPATGDLERLIADAVENQGRHADRWQHVPDVHLRVHL
jgi:hypothetical protein